MSKSLFPAFELGETASAILFPEGFPYKSVSLICNYKEWAGGYIFEIVHDPFGLVQGGGSGIACWSEEGYAGSGHSCLCRDVSVSLPFV